MSTRDQRAAARANKRARKPATPEEIAHWQSIANTCRNSILATRRKEVIEMAQARVDRIRHELEYHQRHLDMNMLQLQNAESDVARLQTEPADTMPVLNAPEM